MGRRSAGRENGSNKGPEAPDEQSSHKHTTLRTKQCPSTLGTCDFGASGGGRGGSEHPPHPWPRFSDAPGSEPSPSRTACCFQPETWRLPHRGCRWSRLMEETRAVRHSQGQGEAAARHQYQHVAGTHGRANGNGQHLLLTWALGNHRENTWPSGWLNQTAGAWKSTRPLWPGMEGTASIAVTMRMAVNTEHRVPGAGLRASQALLQGPHNQHGQESMDGHMEAQSPPWPGSQRGRLLSS